MFDSEATRAYAEARKHGEPAEARINGIIRGGFLHNGIFLSHAGPARGVVYARAADLDYLKVHAEEK